MNSLRQSLLQLAIIYALSGSVAIRVLLGPCPKWLPKGSVAAIFVLYFVLISLWPFLRERSFAIRLRKPWAFHLYLVVQSTLVVLIALAIYKENIAILFIPLCMQALMFLPQVAGLCWIAGFTVVMAVLQVYIYGWVQGATVILTYAAAYFFVGSYSFLLNKEQDSARQSQMLFQELREAYGQLQDYTEQAEKIAATEERNRIARELHDSVTQMLFSMNMLTQTALLTHERQPEKLKPNLEKLQTLAQEALTEMRHLIAQLRPGVHTQKGLLPALRKHIDDLQERHRLQVVLDADEEPSLSNEQAHKLFRIAQEALNNVIKYAQVEKAWIRLRVEEKEVSLFIEDEGIGFQEEQVQGQEGMGLSSMRERATLMGATFSLQSQPGKGTQILVSLPIAALS